MIIDPAWWEQQDMRAALAARNIGEVYRTLTGLGVSQRQIATLVGQSQSEVSEIIKGRVVKDYRVLERIAKRLEIPRERMGLSWWGPDGTYCGEGQVAELPEGVNADMLRRHLLALGAAAAVGAPIKGFGELLNLDSGPASAALPSRLDRVHIGQVQDLTRGLREAIHARGSQPQVSSAAAAWADRLLGASGGEAVRLPLMTAVAELHSVAGWAGLDAGLQDRALYHYARALELATESGDAYLQAAAVACAGLTMLEHGHPNEGLKMLQLGQIKAWNMPADHHLRNIVEACALADAATALARMGHSHAASTELAKSRDLWQPSHSEPWGDPNGAAARLEIEQGKLDRAEPFAVASVRRWDGVSERGRTLSTVVLATIHVHTGESDGLAMAHRAITDVTRLSSVQARKRLEPLAATLAGRPNSEAKDLARMARQVAATRV